jgi:transposase InsO family protein
VKWMARASSDRRFNILTQSSRPHHHPDELPESVIARILEIRKERDQCAEVIHHRLLQEGVLVSLSSVKRTLKREGVTKFSKWKKWHTYPEKPVAERPGVLIQIDTMQDGRAIDHLHAYALIDVCSRWGYAEAVDRISTNRSVRFVETARSLAPFSFAAIQSDHGSEFSKWFTNACVRTGIEHHHSRVRTPTDNAFVERFNQTLQQQCLNRVPRSLRAWRKALPEFLHWYNTERPHMGLGMQTPAEALKRFQAID